MSAKFFPERRCGQCRKLGPACGFYVTETRKTRSICTDCERAGKRIRAAQRARLAAAKVAAAVKKAAKPKMIPSVLEPAYADS